MRVSMKFASFGRETDLNHIDRYVTDTEARALLIKMTEAVHDLNEGSGDINTFIECVRNAVYSRFGGVRENALTLLCRIAKYYPQCNVVWRELIQNKSWRMRFEAAGRLYWYIPDDLSDRFFAVLRNDKSLRVREIAVSRYQHRPDESGTVIMGRYDAAKFDERVRRGEVKIIGGAEF